MATAAALKNRRARVRAVREEQARIRNVALSDIRAHIRAAHERRRELLGRVRTQCKTARGRVREAVARKREEARARLNQEIAEMRQADLNRCALRKAKVRHETETTVQRRRRELREQRETAALVRRVESHRKRELAKHSKSEQRAENDDAVRSNLEPELVPVFDVVKAKIRARPGMSRTEAFLHWAMEHDGEVWAIRERKAEAELRALLREEHRREVEAKRAERAVRKCGGKCAHTTKRARATADELAAVPF